MWASRACVRLLGASTAAIVASWMGVSSVHALVFEAPVVIASGFNGPYGIAVDPRGNAYVGQIQTGSVYKITPQGTETTYFSDPAGPDALAMDPSGNLFVGFAGDGNVLEIAPNGTQSTITTPFGFNPFGGLAVDPADDLFLSGSFFVLELTPGGTNTIEPKDTSPSALAVDPAGDLFILDTNANRVIEVTPHGKQIVVASHLSSPDGVAVNSAGEVFIADTDANKVIETTPYGPKATIDSDLTSPNEVAVDPSGDVFITEGQVNVPDGYLVELPVQPRISVSCQHPVPGQVKRVDHGQPVTISCTTLVRHPAALSSAPSPSGTVSFSVTPTGQAGESLVPTSCTLPATPGVRNDCVTELHTATPGTYTVNAQYQSDHTRQYGSAQATVTLN